mmetsp:Transcript_10498/g.15597  ORF Transcript_10498/g.15597 Transcript_10498/m.15597 type:complete len:93 (+) Transcript_10498:202-480(+)
MNVHSDDDVLYDLYLPYAKRARCWGLWKWTSHNIGAILDDSPPGGRLCCFYCDVLLTVSDSSLEASSMCGIGSIFRGQGHALDLSTSKAATI